MSSNRADFIFVLIEGARWRHYETVMIVCSWILVRGEESALEINAAC